MKMTGGDMLMLVVANFSVRVFGTITAFGPVNAGPVFRAIGQILISCAPSRSTSGAISASCPGRRVPANCPPFKTNPAPP